MPLQSKQQQIVDATPASERGNILRFSELVVVKPGHIELHESEMEPGLGARQALVKAEHSIVSAGTEGAGFTGLVREMPFGDGGHYPRNTGYGHVGEVLDIGSDVTMCKPGDRVLSFSHHASIVKADSSRMTLPLPSETAGEDLAFVRMAGVSMAALRSSSVQAGDTVLVIGVGLVGNFAAQLFSLAGAQVMVADLSNLRLQKARECGLQHTVNPQSTALEAAVRDWTGGAGAHIVVEAIGISEVVAQAVMLTRRHGEVILLGSPRARARFDVTPMLLRLHLEAIRMIGALEWRWPQHPTERGRDLTTNYQQLVQWVAEGQLSTQPLLTHLASPRDCQKIYDGLTGNKEEFMAAVFDWSKI